MGILFLYVAIVYTNCHRTLLLGLQAEKGRCSVTQFRLQAFVCVQAILLAAVEYSVAGLIALARLVYIKEIRLSCTLAICGGVIAV